MHALAPYLMPLYQKDLLAEAELERRARMAFASRPGVPAWRRSLAGVLVAAAESVDPTRGGHVARRAA